MFVEFILALLPIIWLFIAFLVLKMPGYIGCLIALAISIVESLVIPAFSLTVPEALTAAIEGGIGAIWPICLIILAAHVYLQYLCKNRCYGNDQTPSYICNQ